MNSSSWIWQEFSQEEEERWRKLIADGRITKAGVESCMEEIARRSPEAERKGEIAIAELLDEMHDKYGIEQVRIVMAMCELRAQTQ